MTTAEGTETRLGVCNLCEAICGLQLTLTDGKVTGVRGNPDDPLSRGHICPKGVAIADVYDDPDRLRRPVRRVGEGPEAEWVEITWDEALDLTADGLARAVNEHGRDALGIYFGNPNAHSLGAQTHGVGMLKTFRTRNKFSASSVDQIPHQFVAWQLFGHQLMIPIADLDRTSYFLVFGANPMASNGSLMTVPDFPNRVRELKRRGGKLVVFDPRRTETARVADEHHFVRPATDAVVLLAMVHTLFAEGLTDPAPYVRGLESVRLAVETFTPEYAAQASGVPADEIRRITREFAAADGAAAYGRIGLSTQGFGSICQWAIQCLNILTGNFDREGGVLFPEPAIDIVGRRIIGAGHYDVWRSRVRGVPEFSGELPVSVLREEIETPGEGQIRAVLTVAGNPVLSTPDGKRLAGALDGLDFMASVDLYVNETTRHADVILPPTTALEREQYDLVFHNFAVRNTARYTPPVFEKPEGAMDDWEIFREIALRAAARLERKKPLVKALQERARMSLSPAAVLTGLLLSGRRTTLRALRSTPEGVDLGPLRPTMPERLQTKDKRIHLAPDLVVADLRRLPRVDRGAPRRRAGADRPAAPARQQLVVPQQRATQPGEGPPPPADAPRRPGLPGAHRRRRGPDHLTRRRGHHRGPRDRGHDAGGGLAPPRLRPPGRRHPDGQLRQGRRRLHQRPHRPRAARRLRQRGAERRAGHRERDLSVVATLDDVLAQVPAHRRELFEARLERWLPDLDAALVPLYDDPVAVRDRLVLLAAAASARRPDDLHALDLRRSLAPDWFQRPEVIGYAAYADRFAGTLAEVGERAAYLEDLGVRYLHLMPLLTPRPAPNDGGYAVMDYRSVRPDLGTIEDLRALTSTLRGRGISLCLDLVLNHVAKEHEWARKACAGDATYRDYFLAFPDRSIPDAYERTLPEVFPDFAPGSFTWDDELDGVGLDDVQRLPVGRQLGEPRRACASTPTSS